MSDKNEEKKPFKCNVAETGHCSVHGAEVARRRATDKSIEDLDQDIKENKKYIGELLTFKNTIQGQKNVIAGVAILIVVGSYYYTFIHSQESFIVHNTIMSEHRILRDRVAKQSVEIARGDERYLALMGELKQIDGRISHLIEALDMERSQRRGKDEEKTNQIKSTY